LQQIVIPTDLSLWEFIEQICHQLFPFIPQGNRTDSAVGCGDQQPAQLALNNSVRN
jgi:hypothetical protein